MVGRDYLQRKPPRPSAQKLFLNTRLVPFAANIAGDAEVALDRASIRMGVRPILLVAGIAGLLSFGAYSVMRYRSNGIKGRNY